MLESNSHRIKILPKADAAPPYTPRSVDGKSTLYLRGPGSAFR